MLISSWDRAHVRGRKGFGKWKKNTYLSGKESGNLTKNTAGVLPFKGEGKENDRGADLKLCLRGGSKHIRDITIL